MPAIYAGICLEDKHLYSSCIGDEGYSRVPYTVKLHSIPAFSTAMPICTADRNRKPQTLGQREKPRPPHKNHHPRELKAGVLYQVYTMPETYVVSVWLCINTILKALAPSSPIRLALRPRFTSDDFPTRSLARACPPVMPMRFRERSRDRIVGCPARAPRNT